MNTHLLDILRSPQSGAALTASEGVLAVPGATNGERYPIEQGIPVLLPHGLDTAAYRGEQDAIVRAFVRRSSSYFADNYGAGGNPRRLARHNAVTARLRGMIRPGMAILDAGSGPAVLAEPVLALTERYVAADLSLANLIAGRERVGPIDAVVADLTALPFADGAFDGVMAVGCLEYVSDLTAALHELCRVVKQDGFVTASFPNAASPGRRWEKRVVHPLWKAKQSLAGRADELYDRHLVTSSEAERLLSDAGAEATTVEAVNPGLLGYPLSSFSPLQRAQERLLSRGVGRTRASEILVTARRR